MKRVSILVLTGSLLLQNVLPAGAETIPAGTPVIVKLMETVSSGTHKKGDKISMQVVTDVRVGNKIVIAASTPVQGTVQSAAKRFIAGIGGQLEISVDQTKAVDGTPVPLKYSKETHNGSTLVAAVVAVICCCCAWLIPGKDVSIENGTLFDAVTVSPVDVTVR